MKIKSNCIKKLLKKKGILSFACFGLIGIGILFASLPDLHFSAIFESTPSRVIREPAQLGGKQD
ncbi:MAG: hypothetical protein LBE12_08480 [Planctomycetaceae bacterium]|jgi:hypothetical protein|nr:hypothetical protein [Planctomycetaceae bacterium]